MRRIVVAMMTTISGLALLFSYHTSRGGSVTVAADPPALGSTGAAGSTQSTNGSQTDGAQADGSQADGGSTAGSGARSYAGQAVQTRWGPVQVEIAVENGRIASAKVLQVPWDNGHDQQINSYAVPILNAAAVEAQSANIDSVSGATVTSEGYKASLQSAIDQANL